MLFRPYPGVPTYMPKKLPQWILTIVGLLHGLLKWLNLPPSRGRDFILSYLMFASVVQRFPGRRMMLNDALFRVKTGPMLRSELVAYLSDKELVKRHIGKIVGDEYNVPTLAILRSPEEVDSFVFPRRCVIKPTHASGEYIARKRGEPLDLARIKGWFELSYYQASLEPNYRHLIPKVIVEPFVFGKNDARELKIMCVGGKVRSINCISGRFATYSVVYYDADWNEVHYNVVPKSTPRKFERPENLPEILAVAERLARDFFFTRIDFYLDGNSFKCGEITHCSGGAMAIYEPWEGEIEHSQMLFSGTSQADWNRFFSE